MVQLLPCRTLSVSTLVLTTLCSAFPLAAATLDTADGPILVNNWGYQLQGPPPSGALDPGPLAAAPHDLIVMDFAHFGDANQRYTTAEISSIKNRTGANGQRRVAAAYLSVGEASEFRTYWKPAWTHDGTASSPLAAGAPSFLGPTNPRWPESRKVRYWENDWQQIIYNDAGTGWLDQIVDQGFDAAYLDIVDAYYFWGEEIPNNQKQPGDPTDAQDAARRMIDFIVELTAHARQTNGDFFVIPQNGAFILNDADFAGPLSEDPLRRAAYLDAIGAIGVEDVYFGGDADEDNPFNPDNDTINVLKQDFLNHGKPVFSVDYLTDQNKIEQFIEKTVGDGFIPYVAPDRDLDVLASPVPEPATLSLFALGLLVAGASRYRRPA